jgi:hypothetical protein
MGAQLGSLEGLSFTGDLRFEKGSGDGHLSPYRLHSEPGGGAPLLGTVKDM